jgi:prepilin-type N-terminal cleavage/methylation domain-containing protein
MRGAVKQFGFTLIELSIVLALIGVILYGSMNLLVVGIQATAVNKTVARMDRLEKALLDFRVANGRIPCPSDLTATSSSANYGVEAANQGNCTGGSPAANSISASGAAEGGIPTRALNLADDYMYDGWGHRFRYAVNPDYTVTYGTACTLNANPSITVNDASGAARSTAAIYAIVSHGQNGHGAYTRGGVVVNAGSTNADEQTNCHCTSTAAANTYTATYVEKAPTVATAGSPLTTFDDIVTYREAWQLMTPELAKNQLGCFGYSRAITINSSYVSTVNHTNLSNFPVLFSGTYSYLKTVANGGNVTSGNGYDIIFTSDAAGLNLLPFERESYNASTGAVNFWVQVPTVSGSVNTTIYLWYGGANSATDQSNAWGTWDSNYAGVWHLDETSGTQHDSTRNGNNSSIINVQTQGSATGKIGGADTFDGSSSYIQVGSGVMGSPSSVTLSGWGSLNSSQPEQPNMLVTLGDDVNLLAGDPSFSPSGTAACYYTGGGPNYWYSTGTGVNTIGTGWHYYSYTVDGANYIQTMYIDGVQQGQTTNAQAISYTSPYSGTVTVIGAHGCECGTTFHFAGSIDEVRVSNSARSADWIATEYNNQNSPSTFYTVGSAVLGR